VSCAFFDGTTPPAKDKPQQERHTTPQLNSNGYSSAAADAKRAERSKAGAAIASPRTFLICLKLKIHT
jgi:hypothetical protein